MNDLKEQARRHVHETRFYSFDIAWERRSALMLDELGVPHEIIRAHCKPMPGWGTILKTLFRARGWGDS